MLVSGSYFTVLGLHPQIGRLLQPADDAVMDEPHVVVLSDDYWRTHFGASPGVLDQTLVVNGQPMTIVGVAPSGFTGTTLGGRPQVFAPVTMRRRLEPTFKGFDDRKVYWAYLFARLKPGISIESARASLDGQYRQIINSVEAPLQSGMSDDTMARFKAKHVLVEPGARGQSSVPEDAQVPLTLLFAVTGVVLLIACANIANLLLARSAARSGEMAVRLSIGASRGQLVRQLLSEACLLALLGGAASLLVAQWTLGAMAAMLPPDAARMITFRIDSPVLAFAAAASVGTGLLFGLFPALHSTRPNLAGTLKGVSGQPSGTRSAAAFRRVLVTAQITLSMALLASAGLFLKSLVNVSRVDLGIDVDHMATFGVAPVLNGYPPERSRQILMTLEDRLRAAPGVTGATLSMVPLLSGDNWASDLTVQGFPAGPDTNTNANYSEVGPGFFRTMGIPLLRGREFTDADVLGTPKVAIVNEAFVEKFKLGNDAVGHRLGEGRGDVKLDTEIVGVVRNAKYSEVKDAVPPVYYEPYRQDKQLGFGTFYVRTSGDPQRILSTVTGVVKAVDPTLSVGELRTMPQQVHENVFLDRFISTLSTAFALLATLLAAVGLYGVLAYTVAQRTREFGLRMALGADPRRVRGIVLRQVGWMALIGGAVGLAGAIGVGQVAQSVLFQIRGYNPVVLSVSAAVLTLIALAAGLAPARRASRIDPMRALRYE